MNYDDFRHGFETAAQLTVRNNAFCILSDVILLVCMNAAINRGGRQYFFRENEIVANYVATGIYMMYVLHCWGLYKYYQRIGYSYVKIIHVICIFVAIATSTYGAEARRKDYAYFGFVTYWACTCFMIIEASIFSEKIRIPFLHVQEPATKEIIK